jgi:hypothetical protein
MKEKDSPMDAPPDKIQELTPFTHKVNGGTFDIGVESQGKNSDGTDRSKRYYFNHPWKKDKNGRAEKVRSTSLDVIKSLLEAAVKDAFQDSVTLKPEEFAAYEDDRKLRIRLEAELAGTGLTPDTAIGNIVPTLRLLIPEQVTLARALEDGRAFHVPAHPMIVEDIIDGLIPLIARDSTERYAKNLDSNCEPLRIRFHGQPVHRIRPQDLERLLKDVEEGKLLTDEQKRRILLRHKWTAPPMKSGREKWYMDKSLVHHFDGWRRIFIRAQALGAWPMLRPIPTAVMEQPKADIPELEALSAEDWEILLPALDKEMLRCVALLLADTRAAEMERLNPKLITCDADGIPISAAVPPVHAKGKKGKKKGRNITLVPYVSVLLYLAKPEGDQMFSRPVPEIMDAINAKARELGIETTHNCLRKMHDTYWYGLKNVRTARNVSSSHSPQLIDTTYRSPASFEDCLKVYSAFPPNTPSHLKQWALQWLDGFKGEVRGGAIPAPEKTLDHSGPPSGTAPGESSTAEADWDEDDGDDSADGVGEAPPPPGPKPAPPTAGSNGGQGSELPGGTPVPTKPQAMRPEPLARGRTAPQPDPVSPDPTNGSDSPPKPTGTETGPPPHAGAPAPLPNRAPLPEPPRLQNGQIYWKSMSQEFLDNVFSNYTAPQIAGAWGIHVTGVYVKIWKWQKSATLAGAKVKVPASGYGAKKRARRYTIPWPASKADFLQEIWDVPATKICLRLGCSHGSVIMKAAELGFPRPGNGYFQKRNSGIDMTMTAEAKELLLRLRAEEEAAQKGCVNPPLPHPTDGPLPASSPMAGSGAKASAPAETKAHAAAAEIHDQATVAAPVSPTVGPASSSTAQPAAPPAPASAGSSPAI